jgi:Ti-type conjugative transfer relaxase TraA
MAIYHLSGTVISRSQGRSAVACAAYRSAERLHDERYDKTHDYTRKQDVGHTEILLPEKAPEWMHDREKLWNAVEADEKRKDAQLAREFNFALPRELTLEQNIVLAREFVTLEFVSKGMVADLAIHNDKMPDGQLQPHAHVMLTLREITPDGFGQKVRAWNAKENLLVWREAWAGLANQHLFLHGHDLKIDHRTLKEQGIDLEPQYKIGAAVAKERLARLEDHQRIARENGEKILENPTIALDAITLQQSTFTHQDLARFVNRHTVDAEQFQQVYETVKGSNQLVYLGKDDHNRERFTTQAMLAIETQMLAYATTLPQREKHVVNEAAKAHALTSKHLTEEQRLAFEHLTTSGDLKCVVGYAGTGKSYLLGAAREAWKTQGYRVLGATLSGIAAENLTGSSGIESRTLASHFYYWDKGEQLLTSKDILVIDEAGMIGSRQMTHILEQAEKHRVKVILVGDPEQLQAIEAGAAFRAISEGAGYVELTDIRRQREDWQKEATRELATGKTAQALERYNQHQHVHAFETQAAAQQGLISLWNDTRIRHSEKTQIMLAYTRQEVRELNDMARDLRRQQGELGQDHRVMTARGERSIAEHDRIYFLKNDRQLGVMNGTLGTVEAIHDAQITIRLDRSEQQLHQESTVTIHLNQYNHIDHGYAATIHKGQGVTVDRSYILASRYLDRHATYVAATRHRESMDIFYSRETFACERELVQTLSRERAKDITLDYRTNPNAFAQYRGIEKLPQHHEQDLSHAQPPEKSIEQNQASRYEQLLQQAAQDYNRMQERPVHQHNDFSRFKTEFEAQNPERAKALQENLRPRHERLALEAEKQIQRLEKAIEQSRMPRSAREQLGKYAAGVAKQPEVMAYLKQHNSKLTQKIENLSKSHALERDRGGRSL